MKATIKSWEIHPFSGKKSPLNVQAEFTDLEFEKISRGFIPMEMEDKWFIYMEDGTLWCHRSWTGGCIFEARFAAKAGDKYIIKEAFTEELKDEEDQKVKTYLGKMLLFLIDAILLGKNAMPPEMEDDGQNPVESFGLRFHLYGYAGVAKLEIDCIAEVMKEIREEKKESEIETEPANVANHEEPIK